MAHARSHAERRNDGKTKMNDGTSGGASVCVCACARTCAAVHCHIIVVCAYALVLCVYLRPRLTLKRGQRNRFSSPSLIHSRDGRPSSRKKRNGTLKKKNRYYYYLYYCAILPTIFDPRDSKTTTITTKIVISF